MNYPHREIRTPRSIRLFASLLSAAVLLASSSARAAILFYDGLSEWSSAAGSDISILDLFVSTEVAKADEVSSAPDDGALLGTSTLTFAPAATGFDQTIPINLLESTDFEFRTTGNQPGLEPSGSTQENFSQTFSAGVSAVAMVISEQQESSTWSVFPNPHPSASCQLRLHLP